MPTTNDNNLLHWLNIDWVRQHSTLANDLGLPLVNRFACFLNAPKYSEQDPEMFKHNEWLEMQVMSADVPNIGIEAVEQELNGTRRFYFKGRNDDDLGITFMESPSLTLRRFFYNWMQLAIDISEKNGVKRKYMDKYMPSPSEFLIFPLDYKGQASYCDRFINVIPYDISGISYNYAEAGEVIKTTVKFKYMYHHITPLNNSDPYHKAVHETMTPNIIK
jgi:hypothetical protein